MKSQVSNAQHRENARGALNNKWGTMAWIAFASGLISFLVGFVFQSIVGTFFGRMGYFLGNSSSQTVIDFILDNFLFFAITYGTYFCALQVIRGEKVNTSMLMTVFQSKYYIPMLLINFIEYVVSMLISLVVLIPVLLTSGIGIYVSLMFNKFSVDKLQGNFVGGGVIIIILIVSLVVLSILGLFVSGVFQFAVWTKFDYPDLAVGKALRYGVSLMKGRFGQYILLQLSFIGWFILGILALFIGLLWVIPYNQVALASFYQTACEEQGPLVDLE